MINGLRAAVVIVVFKRGGAEQRSNRPIQQAYVSAKPESEDARRYVNYENLADLMHGSARRMILRKEDIQILSRDYDIQVVAEDDTLVYALIRRR